MEGVHHLSSKPRRVGLNAHLLSLTRSYRGAGINNYILRLLQGLCDTGVGVGAASFEYCAYLFDPAFVAPPGLEVRRSAWSTYDPARRIVWEQTCLARESFGLDLLHGLAFAAPLAAACPTVITVHDVSFLRFPEAFRPLNRLYLSFATRISTRRARRVIAVSESTRQDVIRFFGVPPERVVVIPNGVTGDFHPHDLESRMAFCAARGLPERYLLYVGTIEPRKNLVRLLEAYALWRSESGEMVKLVIAGGKGWYYDQVFKRAEELDLGDDVIFPGFVPAEDLPLLYSAAQAFLYPSLFEGFGLPVLEAMACGTPTITSTASALPEVAGDAALLVDPGDARAIADAIGAVVEDAALAGRLRYAGPRRAAEYSWSRTAAETVQVYREALDG